MKHIVYLMVGVCLFLSLSNCAKPQYYQSNGVHYFTKPERELSAYLPFKANDNERMWCGKGLLVDSTLYLPARRMPEGNKANYNLIYAYDTKKQTLSDSLVLTNPKGLSSVSRIVQSDGLYLIGIYTDNNVRKLVVIKTDEKFTFNEAYPFDLEAMGIKEATIYENELHILIYISDNFTQWLKINTGTMTPIIAKTFKSKQLSVDMGDGKLYVANNDTMDRTLNIYSYALDNPDASPEVIAFPFKLSGTEPDSTRQLKLTVNQDTALFTYTNKADIDEFEAVTTIMKLDLKTRGYKSLDIQGYTFDVLEDENRIIVFKSVFKASYRKFISYQALAISIIDKDFNAEEEQLCYIPSEWNYAFEAHILPDKHLVMVGTYQMISKKTQVNLFIPFVGFFKMTKANELI